MTTSSSSERRVAGISDEAVRAKTGKTWPEWIAALDKAGAASMDHPAIAKYLYRELGVPDWWSQMVTVGYEQARGRRQVHQTARGFQITRTKTINVSAARAFAAWSDAAVRRRWLPDPALTVRKATRNKSLRISWTEDKSNLSVGLISKGSAKTQVAVDHSGLKNARQAEQMKQFWSAALSRLKTQLEGGRPTSRRATAGARVSSKPGGRP